MLAKKKLCDGECGKLQYIWKNYEGKRYCRQCWSAHPSRSKPKPTVSSKPIPSRSRRREKEERVYTGLRIIFLSENPVCHAHLPFCTVQATDVHHKEGRVGKLLLDTTKWLPVCRACHMWIETHPKEAVEKGFSLLRTPNDPADKSGEPDVPQKETEEFLGEEMEYPSPD